MKTAISEMIERLKSMREELPPHEGALEDHLYDAQRSLKLALRELQRDKWQDERAV